MDAEAATAAVTAYMMDVAAANFAQAWARLSPATQAAFGSEEAFASERAAYMQSAGGIYRLATPAHDLALLAQWVSPDDPAGPPLARAFIVQVDYPRLSDNPAGFEILIAAPDASGEWLIWKVR